MSIGSGLGGSVGIAVESTYGTYAAPTRFHEVDKVGLKKRKNTAQGGGLAAGRIAQPGIRRVVTAQDAGGPLEMEVLSKTMGILLGQIFGSSTGPTQQGATAAYLSTFPLADNVGDSLTIQEGIPDTTGTVRPYTFKGCKVLSAEFKCGGPGELLKVAIEYDARQMSEVETIAAPSLPGTALLPFHFGQMGVKLGTYDAEAAVQGIKGMSLKIERGQETGRQYANNAGLKSEPLMNDFVKVTGSFTSDFVDKTILADRFASDASTALVWEFIGPLIASTFYQRFALRVPMLFLDDGAPELDGPGVVSGDFPFVAQLDLTNPLVTCEYVSTDTTL